MRLTSTGRRLALATVVASSPAVCRSRCRPVPPRLGADYDRIDNGGKGDAYETLPGFRSASGSNGGWPQAVDNYQRLNYNVVRLHQEIPSPYMLDVLDEMGQMAIGESAIRGSAGRRTSWRATTTWSTTCVTW